MQKYLLLDRDGVINERLPGRYVQNIEEFKFAEGSLEAIAVFSKKFDRIFVVTNQQGIGKGLMTEAELNQVHEFMKSNIEKTGGRLDGIYFCPKLATENPICRKPNPGMGLAIKNDFPEVDFSKSTMVGDSISDMLFGKRLGMKTVMIESNAEQVEKASILNVDESFLSLSDYSKSLL